MFIALRVGEVHGFYMPRSSTWLNKQHMHASERTAYFLCVCVSTSRSITKNEVYKLEKLCSTAE